MKEDKKKAQSFENDGKSVADDRATGDAIYVETISARSYPVAGATTRELNIFGQYLNTASGDCILGTYEVLNKTINSKMSLIIHTRHTGWEVELASKLPRWDAFETFQDKALFYRKAEECVKLGIHHHIATCYYVRTIESMQAIFT
jgi:hypothetical protein